MADKYPNLAKMGVNNPQQIVSYNLSQRNPSKDVLRLRYHRVPGSFLPATRTYEFDRTPKASDPSTTIGGDIVDYEISPILEGALNELDSIVSADLGRAAIEERILAQLSYLEEEVIGEITSLRANLAKLRSSR